MRMPRLTINFGPRYEQMTYDRVVDHLGAYVMTGPVASEAELTCWHVVGSVRDFVEGVGRDAPRSERVLDEEFTLWTTCVWPKLGVNPFSSLTSEHVEEILEKKFGELVIEV